MQYLKVKIADVSGKAYIAVNIGKKEKRPGMYP